MKEKTLEKFITDYNILYRKNSDEIEKHRKIIEELNSIVLIQYNRYYKKIKIVRIYIRTIFIFIYPPVLNFICLEIGETININFDL
jgi:hypothetical protein